MLIAVVAMFLQQTCGSVARVLPAVLAPLIIHELNADPSWVGMYFGLVAIAQNFPLTDVCEVVTAPLALFARRTLRLIRVAHLRSPRTRASG